MSDSWAQRGADDYAQAIESELPTGAAWPREPESDLMRWVAGCALIWAQVDSRAADFLIRESDPRATIEMLADWEAAFGLPDPCVAEPLTIDDRRRALINRITIQGGQSRAFFLSVAAALGYTVVIQEYAPVQCGISRCGDTRPDATELNHANFFWRIGNPDMRYLWRVKILNTRLSWFRAGSGQAGVDPMLRIALATDLECVFRRWKPAHTQIVFDYSEIDYTSASDLDFSLSARSGQISLLF
jgi:uncharacterized protein YmfQ (DUF2313 family)